MLTVKPHPYQDKAIDMALDRGNLLIAYGMGLGKTLIQMGISEELLGTGEVTMNAIVVPASLKWQWAQALVWGTDIHSRDIRFKKTRITIPVQSECVVIDGPPAKRDELYSYAIKHRPDYIILGYENVVNDWRFVKRLHPELISLDEATAIKSFGAERTQMLKEWDADFRYALTGTPIDNRPEELYSIMEWVDPSELGRWDLFDKAYIVRDGFGRQKKVKNIDVLHQKTKTFMARKTRFDADVKKYMPKDYERQYYVDLTGKTKEMYRQIAAELVEDFEEIGGLGSVGFDVAAYYSGQGMGMGGSEEQGRAMSKYGVLAMLCDHPLLVVDSGHKFRKWIDSAVDGTPGIPEGSKFAWELLEEGKLDWINDKIKVPKFEAAMEEIEDLLDENPKTKIILFSFTKKMLRLFRDRLAKIGVQSVIYDGSMTTGEREVAKMSFKRDPKVRVFLSSDAGGMGVDLPEANYLINYNHPWSAGKADQRNSRHIRAGSAWDEVWVLDYLVKGSVEEWKYEVLGLKRRIGSAILDGTATTNGEIEHDVESLARWLDTASV